jgi:hypothetical protein
VGRNCRGATYAVGRNCCGAASVKGLSSPGQHDWWSRAGATWSRSDGTCGSAIVGTIRVRGRRWTLGGCCCCFVFSANLREKKNKPVREKWQIETLNFRILLLCSFVATAALYCISSVHFL